MIDFKSAPPSPYFIAAVCWGQAECGSCERQGAPRTPAQRAGIARAWVMVDDGAAVIVLAHWAPALRATLAQSRKGTHTDGRGWG
eukprot:gene8314-58952_t